MKKLILLSISLLLSTLMFAQVGGALPSTDIKNSKGQTVAFNSIFTPGKVTIVSVWNLPCIPCRQELNAVKRKLAGWKKEADIDYKIVSIDDTRSMSKAKGMVRSNGWPFEDFYDPNSDLKRSLNFQEVPFTFIVDKKGKIAYMHTSYKPGSEDILFKKAKELANK